MLRSTWRPALAPRVQLGPGRLLDDPNGEPLSLADRVDYTHTGVHPWGRAHGVVGAAAAAVSRP